MRPVWQTLWNYQPTLVGLRFIVSFLILLMPTTLMGLTLPVLIEDPMLRQMTEKMSRTAEVHLVAAIRKNCDKENHRGIESHASDAGSIKRNCFVDWIWEKLKTDFGISSATVKRLTNRESTRMNTNFRHCNHGLHR
jgi:hypothetical protein